MNPRSNSPDRNPEIPLPKRPVVGLLALTLDLYETLAPDLRASREQWLRDRILPELTPRATVLFDAAVFRRDAAEEAVRRFEAEGADLLLVLLLTYAPSQMVLPALQRTRLPIVIWNTQELWSVEAGFSIGTMLDNHGLHGTQDLANVLVRSGVRFEYLTCHVADPDGVGELTDMMMAAAAAQRLRPARIGCLGHPFPGMGDLAVDTTHLASTLGCEPIHLPIESFIERSRGAPHQAVQDLIRDYREQYAVDPEVTAGDLEATARVEWALRRLVAEERLDALTYQFLALGEDERTPTVPFVALSRLMAEGIGFGGEGDLVAAAGSTWLNWLQAPASFSEMFTVDFSANGVFMSHMGEANIAMARRDRKTALVARPTPITRTRNGQLSLVTAFEPGPATLMALTQVDQGRWRVIVSRIEIDDFGPLPGLYVPHFKIRPAGNVREFLNAYARAGGPHHNAICFGDARRRLRLAAGLIGADYCEV